MGSNETGTLWISIGSALFAMFLLYSYSQEKKSEYDKRFGSKKSVVLAKEDINEMETIDISKIEMVDRPVDFIEPAALSDAEEAVGQVASAPIKKGEQLLQTKLLRPGPLTGISRQVAPTKRAVTVPVDEMRGVAKLLKPGDRIDLIAAVDVGKGASLKREVKTILQDVVILATGVRIVNSIPRLFEMGNDEKTVNRINLNGDTNFSTVTVETSPQEAQTLIYLLSTAPSSIFLSLRNPNDRMPVRGLTSTTLDTVLGRISRDEVMQDVRAPTSVLPPPPPQPLPKALPPKKKARGPYEDL